MLKRQFFATFAVTAALATPALGQFHSGNSLHELCQQRQITHNEAFVDGYAAGAVDYAAMSEAANGTRFICIPDGVTLGQVSDVICKALLDSPETRNWPAAGLAHNAVLDAWPCS